MTTSSPPGESREPAGEELVKKPLNSGPSWTRMVSVVRKVLCPSAFLFTYFEKVIHSHDMKFKRHNKRVLE